MENGICINCGEENEGISAVDDAIISSARKLRSFLKMPAQHTIACNDCFAECAKKRAEFEKRRKTYQIGAALFFLLVVGGSAAYRAISLQAFLAAIVGALLLLTLPYAKYFPEFEGGG